MNRKEIDPHQIIDMLTCLYVNMSSLDIKVKRFISFKKIDDYDCIFTKQNIIFVYSKDTNGFALGILYNGITLYKNGIAKCPEKNEWQKFANEDKILSILFATIDKLQTEVDRILDKDLNALINPKENQLRIIKKPEAFQELDLCQEQALYSRRLFIMCFLVCGTVAAALSNFLIVALFGAIITSCYYGKEIKRNNLIESPQLSIKEKEKELDQMSDELDRQISLAEG